MVHDDGPTGVDAAVERSSVVESTSNPQQQQTPPSLQHSDGSDDSQTWRNLSPFSEDCLITLSSLALSQVTELLQQYRDYLTIQLAVPITLDIHGLAECIFERTLGFPGLVGLCCSEIESKGIKSVYDWFKWCGIDLVRRVQQQRNYSVLIGTGGLLAACKQNKRLRQVMEELLLEDSCILQRSERRSIVERLLSEGIAHMVKSGSEHIEVSTSIN